MSAKRILILGGLGFIGKNLYHELRHDHHVTIITDKIHEEVNDGFLNDDVRQNIIVGSILDEAFMETAIVGYDAIFSMAGSSGATDSITNPHRDLDTNLKGHLNVLEACRKYNPKALLIFPSSRLVYGKPQRNPVDENHPLSPESIYAIHKITTEHYYLLYRKLYNMNCVIFRIANPFGPYQRFGSNHYGILNWFIHKALTNEVIEIYGEGSQKRDFIFIDDLVRLFRITLDHPDMHGKIYNVGQGEGISLKDAVRVIAEIVPQTKKAFLPWPVIDKKIETGDYISDISKLKQDTGWAPQVSFETGIRETIRFYETKSRQ
ncbi:MAG TPA: NAD-dependent epimerase/dehydratase family protein [Ohtaekwangia sp.]